VTAELLAIQIETRAAQRGDRIALDLFGGERSQIPGAINVDFKALDGIRTDARNLPFASNTADEIIVSNPYIKGGNETMMDWLPEAGRVMKPGGEIYINVNANNPYGMLPSAAQLESLGLTVVRNNGALDIRFAGINFFSTNGNPLKNVFTIVLRKGS
jgi:filamentous hemagglutinin